MADLSIMWLSGSIVVLLFGSAFFSMSETALMASNRNKLRALSEQAPGTKRGRRAARVLRLLQKPEEIIATILVGNNIVNIVASGFATALALEIFGDQGLAIATGGMTLIVLVWGEVTPKSFAAQRAEWVSMRVAAPISFFSVLFKPVSRALTTFANSLIRGLGGSRLMSTPFLAEDEIKVLLNIGQEEGSIEEHEADFIENVFEFTDREVHEVSRPFSEVNWVRPDDSLAAVVEVANRSGHSRLPVIREATLEVLGMVYVKDLLFISDVDLKVMMASSILRPIGRFHPHSRVAQAFKDMQRTGNHLGMVVEADGHPTGLVSMEDLLEEIVGEIEDEYEMARRRVARARKTATESVRKPDGGTEPTKTGSAADGGTSAARTPERRVDRS